MSGTVLELLGPSTGGIRRHVAALVEGLPGHGWTARTAAPAGVLDGLAPTDHQVPVPAGLDPRGLVRARRALGDALDGVDLVHAHGLKAGWTALGCGRPVVLTVHNTVGDGADRGGAIRRWLLGLLERRVVAAADGVIVVSPELAERLGPLSTPPRVVPAAFPVPVARQRPAEVRAALGLAPDTPVVLCVARLHPQKDLPLLIGAMAGVHRTLPGARALIVGEGPEEAPLRGRIRSLGLDDVVHLLGARDDVADLMGAADVVAISSRWEGSPLVAGEALLAGRPLVSTAVGTVPELVGEDGGRIVPTGDEAALAAALVDLLSDPVEAARLGAVGRRRAMALLDPGPLIEAVAHSLTAAREAT